MKVRQCVLNADTAWLTAWLPDRRDLRPGVYVTLSDFDDPGRRWRVLKVGGAVREKAAVEKIWNVGGVISERRKK